MPKNRFFAAFRRLFLKVPKDIEGSLRRAFEPGRKSVSCQPEPVSLRILGF